MGGTGLASFGGYQGALINPGDLGRGATGRRGEGLIIKMFLEMAPKALFLNGFFDNGPLVFMTGAFNYYGLRQRFFPVSGSLARSS
ncbi:MAG: hypothetical protein R2827_01170 [Bdellovibrionales bacterium]